MANAPEQLWASSPVCEQSHKIDEFQAASWIRTRTVGDPCDKVGRERSDQNVDVLETVISPKDRS